MKRIYADAAAATPLSKVSRRELERLLSLYGNAGGLHKEGIEAKRELEAARASIAASIGAHPDEIIFSASGTEANNLAVQGFLRPLLREHGELHAITSAIEHQSVLEALRALEPEGLYLTELPVDAEGLVSLSELKDAINEQTVFVSVQLVNSEVGTIEPVKEIAKQIRRIRIQRGETSLDSSEVSPRYALPLCFHTDAAQAPLWLPIKVESLGVDLLSLDAQKILGPKGVGALYIKRGVAVEPVLWGGSQERGLRAGTENVPLAGAFAVALAAAPEQAAKIAAVRDYLWDEIKKALPDVVLNGPDIKVKPCYRVSNNLNISIPGLDAEMAVIALDALGVAASTRSACDTGSSEPSHVIKALGIPDNLSKTAIRLTLLPDATRAQAKRIAQALAEVAGRYRIVVQ